MQVLGLVDDHGGVRPHGPAAQVPHGVVGQLQERTPAPVLGPFRERLDRLPHGRPAPPGEPRAAPRSGCGEVLVAARDPLSEHDLSPLLAKESRGMIRAGFVGDVLPKRGLIVVEQDARVESFVFSHDRYREAVDVDHVDALHLLRRQQQQTQAALDASASTSFTVRGCPPKSL